MSAEGARDTVESEQLETQQWSQGVLHGEPLAEHDVQSHLWIIERVFRYFTSEDDREFSIYARIPGHDTLAQQLFRKNLEVSRSMFVSPNEALYKGVNSEPTQERFKSPIPVNVSETGLRPKFEGSRKYATKNNKTVVLFPLPGFDKTFATIWWVGSTWRGLQRQDDRPEFKVWRYGMEIVNENGEEVALPVFEFSKVWHLHLVLPESLARQSPKNLDSDMTLPTDAAKKTRKRKRACSACVRAATEVDAAVDRVSAQLSLTEALLEGLWQAIASSGITMQAGRMPH